MVPTGQDAELLVNFLGLSHPIAAKAALRLKGQASFVHLVEQSPMDQTDPVENYHAIPHSNGELVEVVYPYWTLSFEGATASQVKNKKGEQKRCQERS